MMTGRIAVNHIFNAKRMAIHGKIKANQITSMQIKLRQCKSNDVNANQTTSMQIKLRQSKSNDVNAMVLQKQWNLKRLFSVQKCSIAGRVFSGP